MQIFAEAGSYHPPSGDEPNDWIVHLTTGDLSLGTYSIPAGGVDDQQPHTEDEIYVVTAGQATLEAGGQAAPTLTQIEEVRSCNGYYSASDLRIHFGLNEAKKVDLVEIRWPSGAVDTLKDLDVNRLYVVEEGGKLLKNEALTAARKKA